GAPQSGAPQSGAPQSGAPQSGAPLSGAPQSGHPHPRPPAQGQPFLAPSGLAYPPPQAPNLHEQPTPAGAFPSPGPAYGPPPTPYGAMPPPGAHLVGPAGSGSSGRDSSADPKRRALLIGGAAASVAAVGGIAAWLLTRSDGGGDGAESVGDGPGATGDPTKPAQGGSTSSPNAPKPVYKIGLQAGLSGENSALGINVQNGVTLAVEQANQRGDLAFTVELVSADDQAKEANSPAAARKLIDAEVIAVVGPVFSGPTRAAANLYEDAGLACVSPSATNPSLTQMGYSFFNRATPHDYNQGTEIANYLVKKVKAASVLVVDDKSEYATGLAEAVRKGVGNAATVTPRSIARDTPDSVAAALEAKNSNVAAVVYAGYYQDAAPFAMDLTEAGYKGARVGPDGVADDNFVKLAGAASEGWFLTVPAVDANAEPALRDFAAAYQAKFSDKPGTYCAEAFDVVNLVVAAIKSLGGQKPTRAAMKGAIRAIRYQSPVKEYAFDRATGEFAGSGAIYGYEVKASKITYAGSIRSLTGG
ncbi:ABC transporter substrate-binding protein, partial [Streptodolium elevatio]